MHSRWIWHEVEKFMLGLDLNEKPMEQNGVDDGLKPIVKLPQACEYAQLLSNIVVKHPCEFLVINVTNMQSLMDKLNKASISNINKHHQNIIDSYFYNVWYDEEIIMGINFIKVYIIWHCEHISLIKRIFIILMYLHYVYKVTFYIEWAIFLQTLGSSAFEAKIVIFCRIWHSKNATLSCMSKHVLLKGENSVVWLPSAHFVPKKTSACPPAATRAAPFLGVRDKILWMVVRQGGQSGGHLFLQLRAKASPCRFAAHSYVGGEPKGVADLKHALYAFCLSSVPLLFIYSLGLWSPLPVSLAWLLSAPPAPRMLSHISSTFSHLHISMHSATANPLGIDWGAEAALFGQDRGRLQCNEGLS